MDYETLRKYQRMERNSSNLAEISPSFYSELSSLIREYSSKYETTRSLDDSKSVDNIRKIAQDIFERREQKIILKALRCVRNHELKENNVTENEKALIEGIEASLKENREDFGKILAGETVIAEKIMTDVLDEKIEKMQETPSSEGLNMVLVRIIKNIPKFVSSDMTELGPFEANEIKRLPQKEAILLSEKQFAELI